MLVIHVAVEFYKNIITIKSSFIIEDISFNTKLFIGIIGGNP